MESSGIAKRRAAAKLDKSKQYAERRESIIATAAEVFKAKGLAATSVDDVAQAAGVDRASLYYYVGSKRELFEEVVFDAVQKNIELAETIRDGEGDAIDKLRRLIHGMMHSYVESYPQLYVFVQESADVQDRKVIELWRRFDRALIGIIEQGRSSGELRDDISPRLAAYGLVGMLNWTHRWFDPNGPVSEEEVAQAFSTLSINGLVAAT